MQKNALIISGPIWWTKEQIMLLMVIFSGLKHTPSPFALYFNEFGHLKFDLCSCDTKGSCCCYFIIHLCTLFHHDRFPAHHISPRYVAFSGGTSEFQRDEYQKRAKNATSIAKSDKSSARIEMKFALHGRSKQKSHRPWALPARDA